MPHALGCRLLTVLLLVGTGCAGSTAIDEPVASGADDVVVFAPVIDAIPSPCDDDAVVLDDECLTLGPQRLDRSIVESATAAPPTVSDAWSVALVFTEDGLASLNDLAAGCFATDERCPTGRLAILADGRILLAPVIAAEAFERDQIIVSPLTLEEAHDMADALNGNG